MKENTKGSNEFRWVFFMLSSGALVTAGIFIEKIVLTELAWMDVLSAVVFGAMGLGISAYSFFHSSAN